MAIRNIVTQGDSCLEKVCRPVTEFNARLHMLLDDMKETLAAADGAGLAAPQVGVLRRAAIIVDGEGGYLELINPEILDRQGSQDGPEGCLSVPGEYGLVKRPYKVRVRAQDRNGQWFEVEGEGLTGRCFCHELDHLDGILFTQKCDRMLTEEELETGEF